MSTASRVRNLVQTSQPARPRRGRTIVPPPRRCCAAIAAAVVAFGVGGVHSAACCSMAVYGDR